MESALDELLVSAAELAADFRISDVELAKLARRGILPRRPHPTDKRAHIYPYRACTRAYVAHLKSQELAAHQSLIEAKSRQADIKTRREELKLEIESGVMVRRDYILSAFEPYLLSFRQTMLSRPSRLERRLSKAKSREARLKILEEDAQAALASLAEVLQSGGNGQNGQSPKKKAF
jgi:hypothetical protein